MKYDLHKIPSPPSYPIIGHLHHLIQFGKPKIALWAYKWYQKLGQPPVMLIDAMSTKTLIINDPSFIQQKLLVHNGYDKEKNQSNTLLYIVDDKKPAYTIAATRKINPAWKAIRKAVVMSFSTEGLKQKFPDILTCLDRFEENILKQKKPFEGQISFTKLTLDIIMLSGFEYKFDSYNRGEELIKDAGKSIINAIIKNQMPVIKLISYMFPKSSFAKQYRETMDYTRNAAEEALDAYRSKEKNEDSLSIIANLSRVIDPETGEKLSDFKLVAEIVILIFAGFMTTGIQLSWIFILLTIYPECEDKILKELKEHNLNGNSQKIEYNILSKLTYLNAFFKECMRIASVVIQTSHVELPNDEIVCGYRVPKGTTLAILNRANHMKKSIWHNPDEFVPERWLSENSSTFSKNLTTFSHGPRNCVGMQLAITEILTTLIFLIPKYKIRFVNDEKKTLEELINETYSVGIMNHEKGLFFESEKRN